MGLMLKGIIDRHALPSRWMSALTPATTDSRALAPLERDHLPSPKPGSQLATRASTDRDGESSSQRPQHGVGLNHLPSGRFPANGAWLAVQVLDITWPSSDRAHRSGRVTTKTLRRRTSPWPDGSHFASATGLDIRLRALTDSWPTHLSPNTGFQPQGRHRWIRAKGDRARLGHLPRPPRL